MQYPKAVDDLIEVLNGVVCHLPIRNRRQEIILPLQKRVDIDKLLDVFKGDFSFLLFNSEAELYFVTQGFYVWCIANEKKLSEQFASKINLLNPIRYFTEREISDYDALPLINPQEKSDTFTLKNVVQVTPQMWTIPIIDMKEILDMFNSTLVIYDYSMQRESVKKKSKFTDEVYEEIKIYEKSLKEIEDRMLKGDYTPTAISINILQSDNVSNFFEFDAKTGTLTLSKKDRNSLIDGMHRSKAGMNALMKDSSLDQKMQLNIFNYTITQARDFIYQEGQKNPIPKNILKNYNSQDIHMNFVNEISGFGNADTNLLKNKLGDEKLDVLHVGKYTTKKNMAIAIEDNYRIDFNSFSERRDALRFTISFFNELLSKYPDDIKDSIESRKNNVVLHPNVFFAYIKIASMLLDVKDWEKQLKKIINALKFPKKNLENFGLTTYEITIAQKEALYSYAESVVQKCIKEGAKK